MMMSIDDTNLDRDNGLDFNESLIPGNYHLPGGPHDDKSQNSKTLEDKKKCWKRYGMGNSFILMTMIILEMG